MVREGYKIVFPICQNAPLKTHTNQSSGKKTTQPKQTQLQLVAHLVAFGPHEPADEEDGVGFSVLDHEDEGVVGVEEFGVPHLLSAVDVGVVGVPFRVPLQSRGVEHVGQVKVFLAGDLGQVSLGFVNGFCQAQTTQVFLGGDKRSATFPEMTQCKGEEGQQAWITHHPTVFPPSQRTVRPSCLRTPLPAGHG